VLNGEHKTRELAVILVSLQRTRDRIERQRLNCKCIPSGLHCMQRTMRKRNFDATRYLWIRTLR
jgi:hypothetical protein